MEKAYKNKILYILKLYIIIINYIWCKNFIDVKVFE